MTSFALCMGFVHASIVAGREETFNTKGLVPPPRFGIGKGTVDRPDIVFLIKQNVQPIVPVSAFPVWLHCGLGKPVHGSLFLWH